ncbi:MAG TPA: glycine cleavage system aminomethyltransferase GcvT [Acidobacteriaceae bacterium]|nr:glycine cleavage system aminomethyltransferase GcvT [Acidobacteriaceae bacterium]
MSSSSVPATAPTLQKTALNPTHRQSGAKMVDFGGWDMPVEYAGLIAEHMAVRTRVGIFDVSHMGEIHLRGPEALDAVQFVSMNDASKLAEGQAQYSALLTPQGTFVDDILVYKFSPNDYLLVVNAGTRPKDYAWIKQHAQRFHCHVSDYSDHYSQLAIQGPQALATLQKLTRVDLNAIKNYWFVWGQVCGIHNVLISRTGYTGEDGFEIYIPSDAATTTRVWQEVLDAGREFEIVPCGLGARNTLRMEASMPLYGHEITEETNVFEAGLDRFCKLDKPEFLGQAALRKLQEAGGPQRKLVGMEMMERGIGRDGYPICTVAGEQIGAVTSGSPAPFLKKNIALGYVPIAHSAIDTVLAIKIRGQDVRTRIAPQPFYRRPKKHA